MGGGGALTETAVNLMATLNGQESADYADFGEGDFVDGERPFSVIIPP